MTKPYPMELLERAVRFVFAGESRHAVAAQLTAVQSIEMDTFRLSSSKEEFEERLVVGRLSALAHAHDPLSKTDDKQITLQTLIV